MPAQGGVTHMECRLALSLGLVLLIGGVPVRAGSNQESGGQSQPEAAPAAAAPAQDGGLPPAVAIPDPPPARPPAEAPGAGQAVKPLTEGPLHEAFLSPRKDRKPVHVAKTPPAPIIERPGGRSAERERPVDRGLLGMGRGPEGLRLGDRHLARPAAGPVLGQRLLEARRSRAGIGSPASGATARPTGSTTARTARPPTAPTTSPASRPAATASTSPASIIPTATAWSGRRASGPRPSRAGRGSPRSGSASPKAGSSRTATGTAPSKIAAPCSPPPRSTSRPSNERRP